MAHPNDHQDEESGGPSRKREAKKRKRAAAPGGKPGQQASRVMYVHACCWATVGVDWMDQSPP